MARLRESLYVSAHFNMQQNVYQPITLQLDRLTNTIYDTSFDLPIISYLFSYLFCLTSLFPSCHVHTHTHTHTHPLTAVTTDACSSWAPWLELMEGSHKWRRLCTGGRRRCSLCHALILPRPDDSTIPESFINSSCGPSAKHKQYLTEVRHRHALSTLNLRFLRPLSVCFASLSSSDTAVVEWGHLIQH